MDAMNLFRKWTGAATLVGLLFLTACGAGDTKDKEQKDSAATSGAEQATAATDSPGASTNDCLFQAKIGALQWSAKGVKVTKLGEHLTISYEDDPDQKDKILIDINNFKGPGTYTFDGNDKVMFFLFMEGVENFKTNSRSIVIEDFSASSFKATFKFNVTDTMKKTSMDVAEGRVVAKNEVGGCIIEVILFFVQLI